MISSSVIPNCHYSIAGKPFQSTFKVLPLHTYDIILGADWLKQHSPDGMDFIERTLVIKWKNKPLLIHDYTKDIIDRPCSDKQVEKILDKGAMGYIIQINLIAPTEEKQQVVPPHVQNLLEYYAGIF